MHFIEELAKQIRSRGPNSRTYVLVLNTFPCECTHAFKILIWSYQYCSVFVQNGCQSEGAAGVGRKSINLHAAQLLLSQGSYVFIRHLNLREGTKKNFADKKRLFLGKFLPNMGGWGHSFPNENHNFWTNENSPFVLPNLTKTLGWVGKQIWERSPKKNIFLDSFPKCESDALTHWEDVSTNFTNVTLVIEDTRWRLLMWLANGDILCLWRWWTWRLTRAFVEVTDMQVEKVADMVMKIPDEWWYFWRWC